MNRAEKYALKLQREEEAMAGIQGKLLGFEGVDPSTLTKNQQRYLKALEYQSERLDVNMTISRQRLQRFETGRNS